MVYHSALGHHAYSNDIFASCYICQISCKTAHSWVFLSEYWQPPPANTLSTHLSGHIWCEPWVGWLANAHQLSFTLGMLCVFALGWGTRGECWQTRSPLVSLLRTLLGLLTWCQRVQDKPSLSPEHCSSGDDALNATSVVTMCH